MFPVVSTPLILAEHDGWWLEAICGCGRCTQIPIRILLKEWRRETELGQIVRRLRCRDCGKPPISTELVEDIQAGAKGTGTAPGRRIPV